MTKLISIKDAAAAGIKRVRMEKWGAPLDHIAIDLIDGSHGPWAHFWAPFNMECNGRDPVDMLIGPKGINTVYVDPDDRCFVPYAGPTSHDREYQAAAVKFKGVLGEKVA